MTAENSNQVKRNAGKLDKIVGFFTAGKYGVEETVAFGFKDDFTGEIFQGDPSVRALKTGLVVSVSDLSKTEHILKRELIKRVD